MVDKSRPARRTSAPRRAPAGDGTPQAAGATSARWVAGAVLAALAAGGATWANACSKGPSPTPHPPATRSFAPVGQPAVSALSVAEVTPDAGVASDGGRDAETAHVYEGPMIGAASQTVPIYSEMEMVREKLIGYLRSGAKAPVVPKPIVSPSCRAGWYKLIPRGHVCGKYATTELDDPRVRLGTSDPKLDQVVPYQYAYNTKDGTPLYRAIPSREQMIQYEPYLAAAHRAEHARGEQRRREAKHNNDAATATEHEEPETDDGAAEPSVADGRPDAGIRGSLDPAGARDAGEQDADLRPWWQIEPDAGRPEIKLSDLANESDSILARRMVKGFFVAVDKTFGWNKRLWYKTTEGLVAPADRMAINKPPSFHGVEIGGPGQPKLPIGFVGSVSASRYELSGSGSELVRKGKAPLHTIAALTGRTMQRGGVLVRETTDGWWMRAIDSAVAELEPPPPEVGPNEKWIDVNLTHQTLVAFEGTRPVYATLVSSGKKSEIKDKDHSTVQGVFRIREKHIAATMDGDAAAPGEGPYSIEDVPYIMYFKGSYALHGAFWHNNFGHKMSHGCVNLAPLDAKHLFQWTSPALPQGWHGVWSTKEEPGTLVFVHE